MMNLPLMDTETMVGMTVLSAAAFTAAVLTIRAMILKLPVRQPVKIESRNR